MRAYLIIFLSPLLYQNPGFLKSSKDLPIEKLIPELAIKGFDISILPGTPRLNKQCLDFQPVQPFPDGFRRKLGSVIQADVLRYAAEYKQIE
jgi:hypothetical protein